MAAFLNAVYIFILYTTDPDLIAEYQRIMLTTLKVDYKDSPFYQMIEDSFKMYLFPVSIAFGELFNKIFMGTIFTLFLAGLVRRRIPINPQEF